MNEEIRCGCNKLLARARFIGRVQIKCPRCGTMCDVTRDTIPQSPDRHRATHQRGRLCEPDDNQTGQLGR
ncbi:Com family DNA-binding transcriptional regulator [Vitreoscilla filiformis]|uniref:Com family DNA-binding transcriptional regulator n=1 Tax=Vitreoscilla filiformis TaxID=63 RepID=UPI000B79F08A